jgi:hypothetical protein
MNKNNDRETTLDGSHTKLDDDVLMHLTPGIKLDMKGTSSTYRKYMLYGNWAGHQYETLLAALKLFSS